MSGLQRLRFLVLLLALLSPPAFSQLLALAWDNDIAFATDGDYTNGLRISWLSQELSESQLSQSCPDCSAARWKSRLGFLPGLNPQNGLYSTSINLEQLMITPNDLTHTAPQYDDTPYAGLLRLELGLFARGEKSLIGYALSLGATGSASLAGQSQKLVHALTDSTEPRGWDHQLPGRPVVGIAAIYGRELLNHQGEWLQTQVGYGAAARLDNWLVDTQLGVFGSIGQRLPGNLLPAYSVMGSAASLPGLDNLQQTGWALYGGLLNRQVFWSYLEEEGRKAGYQFEGNPSINAVFLSAAVQGYGWLTSISIQKSSPIIERSDKSMNFGSISLIRQW